MGGATPLARGTAADEFTPEGREVRRMADAPAEWRLSAPERVNVRAL
jgi:hypothetical protein